MWEHFLLFFISPLTPNKYGYKILFHLDKCMWWTVIQLKTPKTVIKQLSTPQTSVCRVNLSLPTTAQDFKASEKSSIPLLPFPAENRTNQQECFHSSLSCCLCFHVIRTSKHHPKKNIIPLKLKAVHNRPVVYIYTYYCTHTYLYMSLFNINSATSTFTKYLLRAIPRAGDPTVSKRVTTPALIGHAV